MTDEQLLQYAAGRLYGLCATVRYKLPTELRLELKELAQKVARQEVKE